MSVKQRVLLCRLVEKIEKQSTYSEKLGLENTSRFRGIQIKDAKYLKCN